MRRKDDSVECKFHPVLTAFLFPVDEAYRGWEDELVITSGSEASLHHKVTSLHYADPACAADIRTWDEEGQGRGTVPAPRAQQRCLIKLKDDFCVACGLPCSWIEIILESNHIHIEYQPKRPGE